MDQQEQDHSGEKSGISFQTFAIGAVVSFLLIYVLIFVIGLIAAIVYDGAAASFFAYFRDLLTIALSLTTMVIFVGLGILVIQIARFVNLLRSELKPISEDTRRAVAEIRSTVGFVQKHAVSPIIQTASFLSGLTAFLRELVRISRILQKKDAVSADSES
jgi:hypothetical protein